MKGNAKQISSKDSINLLRFVFFQELTQSEYAAYKELVRQRKESDEHTQITIKNIDQ